MREPLPTRPRKVPKQERSKATVEAILEATVRVLVREGYEGATTSRIAEVSGYGIGSLYDYFPNKNSLVATLIERHAQEMTTLVESNFRAHADSTLPVAVRAWVEAGVEAHLANPELHKVLIEQVPRVGDPERLGVFEGHIAELVRSYLEHCTAKIRPKDLPLASFVVAQAVVSLTHKAVAERPETFADGRLVNEITDLVLGYLASADERW